MESIEKVDQKYYSKKSIEHKTIYFLLNLIPYRINNTILICRTKKNN